MNERRMFLILLIALLGILSFLIFQPFLGYIMGAAILAFLLQPLHERLKSYTGQSISAFILVIVALVAAVIPISMAALAVIQDARDLDNDLRESEVINTTEIENRLQELTGQTVDIEKMVSNIVNDFTSNTVGGLGDLVGIVAELSIGFSIFIFLLYYMLRDGRDFIAWIKDLDPFPKNIQDELYGKMKRTTWDVIIAHVLIAIIQGLVAGVGLALTGVPNYIFWTFIMMLLGFIPIIGTIMVWLPAAIYLFLIDQTLAATFLAIYGFTVVSLTDNFLRPVIIDRGSNINPGVILVGVLGGVYLFGAVGLFIGPIILGMFKSVLLVFKNHYEDL